MPELIKEKKVFTLLEVAKSIRKTIADRYQSVFWVKAEMNKLNYYSYSGHCYPELVEKNDGKVVSQMRASLWREDYLRCNDNFVRTLREPLRDGITILFSATVSFDPMHGLNLRIIEIDPVFSLGELEREKIETIDRLKKEHAYHLNQQLPLPLLPKRIALISVETSKGYSDFVNVLQHNPKGYSFFCLLFPALLQGDRSVDSIVVQLNRIKKVRHHFDAVAIIRGGGGDVGLSSYNHYKLASTIANFPIPVLTGIGHSTNETVSEMVSFKNAITPTELADFLIQKFDAFAEPVAYAREIIVSKAKQLLTDEQTSFKNLIRHFRSSTASSFAINHQQIRSISKTISRQAAFMLQRSSDNEKTIMNRIGRTIQHQMNVQRNHITSVEKAIQILDPVHVLRRGYSITTLNGKVVKAIGSVDVGDTLETATANGIIKSTVVSKTETTS